MVNLKIVYLIKKNLNTSSSKIKHQIANNKTQINSNLQNSIFKVLNGFEFRYLVFEFACILGFVDYNF